MIKSVNIFNFQSHRKTKLFFNPFVNVIEGESLNGKTAIIRAIRWVLFNRPLGFNFHSNFAKEKYTSVEIEFDDGTVELIKDKNKSYYVLNGDYENTYQAMKGNLPDKIKSLMNVDEINIQRQLDSPFLITGSAGEIARMINNITNLEKVDLWVSDLTSDINSENRLLELKKLELESNQENLKHYNILPDLILYNKNVQKYLGLMKGNQKDFLEIENLSDLIDSKMKKFNKRIKIYEDIKIVYEDAKKYYDMYSFLRNKYSLMKKIKELENRRKEIELCEKIVKNLIEFLHLEDLRKELIERVNEIKNKEVKLMHIKRKIKENNLVYIDLMKKNRICPYCFQLVNEEKLRRFL